MNYFICGGLLGLLNSMSLLSIFPSASGVLYTTLLKLSYYLQLLLIPWAILLLCALYYCYVQSIKMVFCFSESDRSDFCFFLDAPISTAQRQEEDRITYLNKGTWDEDERWHKNIFSACFWLHYSSWTSNSRTLSNPALTCSPYSVLSTLQ